MSALSGRRILVVEDEAMVAAMVEDMLDELGAHVVGPAPSIAKALDLARSAAIDAAILDVNVRGERIDPVAEALAARGIPFLFATGYGAAPDGKTNGAPVIDKPYTAGRLAEALKRTLAPAA